MVWKRKRDNLALVSKSVQETHDIAKSISKKLKRGDIVFLEGELGVGKTEMVKGFVKSLDGRPEDVQSPTYLSALNYLTKKGPVIHIDFYKYQKNTNFFKSFISEFLEEDPYLIFVEWGKGLGEGFLRIRIEEKNKKRYITVFQK